MADSVDVVVVGNNGVGKTSIITHWAAEAGKAEYGDFRTMEKLRKITIPKEINGSNNNVRITDTSNDNMLEAAIQMADAIVIVSSLADESSLLSVRERWIPLIEKCRERPPPIIEARNKSDVLENRVFETKAGNIIVMECSCKHAETVMSVLYKAIECGSRPIRTLYTNDSPTLPFLKALSYIYRNYNKSRSGVLKGPELATFTRDLHSNAGVKGITEASVNFSEFTEIFMKLAKSRYARVWAFLKAKGFNSFLELKSISKASMGYKDTNYYFVNESMQYLSGMYRSFDEKKNGKISKEQLKYILFPCLTDPFDGYDFFRNEKITEMQFLSRFALLASCNQMRAWIAARRLGYVGCPLDFEATSDRKATKVIRSVCIGCDVKGRKYIKDEIISNMPSLGCGFRTSDNAKLAIVAAFVGKNESEKKDKKDISKTEKSSYYYFKSTPKVLQEQYKPIPLKPGQKLDYTPRVQILHEKTLVEKGEDSTSLPKNYKDFGGYPANSTKSSRTPPSTPFSIFTCYEKPIDFKRDLSTQSLQSYDTLILVGSSKSIENSLKTLRERKNSPTMAILALVTHETKEKAKIEGATLIARCPGSSRGFLEISEKAIRTFRENNSSWLRTLSGLILPLGLLGVAAVIGGGGAFMLNRYLEGIEKAPRVRITRRSREPGAFWWEKEGR